MQSTAGRQCIYTPGSRRPPDRELVQRLAPPADYFQLKLVSRDRAGGKGAFLLSHDSSTGTAPTCSATAPLGCPPPRRHVSAISLQPELSTSRASSGGIFSFLASICQAHVAIYTHRNPFLFSGTPEFQPPALSASRIDLQIESPAIGRSS
jgi:hypothetical protein